MIPEDRDELNALAGEYVLGLLEPAQAREVEVALVSHGGLRVAVAFWQEQLHPLSALAPPGEPPADLWDKIEARLDRGAQTRWWDRPAPWRWAAGSFAAMAAALLLYIGLAGSPASPRYVAVLHAPQQDQASWIATVTRDGLTIRMVAAASPPPDRAFELWAIAPGTTAPQAIGVIPANGVLRVASLPPELQAGATLAISVEPPSGSPNPHQPTGPVVFVGAVDAL